MRRAHQAQRLGRNFHADKAIDQIAVLVLQGHKQAGKGAARANRIHHFALIAEHHRLARAQVGRHHGQRNLHLLEAVGFQQAAQEHHHPVAPGESEPADGPPRDVAELHRSAYAFDLSARCAGGVGGGNHGPRAYSPDAVDGNAVLLQNPQHADMRNASGKPAAQSDSDPRRRVPAAVRRSHSRVDVPPFAALMFCSDRRRPSLRPRASPIIEKPVPLASIVGILRATLKTVYVPACFVACLTPVFAQREISGAAEAKLALEKLNVTGSVLMIAAHPDDENTALLAYFARGRQLRTGYLSLTRGEGGQNLIGSEQGDALGVIRTQELLAARRIDGAQQFFTRAIDFGFTKTTAETFEKWGHEKILSDVVWVIRRFRPDVIVLRFSGTPRDGHGQHQASAILGKEAFSAAADPKTLPGAVEMGPALAGQAADVERVQLQPRAGAGSGQAEGQDRDRSRRLRSRAGSLLWRDRRHEPQPAQEPGYGSARAQRLAEELPGHGGGRAGQEGPVRRRRHYLGQRSRAPPR